MQRKTVFGCNRTLSRTLAKQMAEQTIANEYLFYGFLLLPSIGIRSIKGDFWVQTFTYNWYRCCERVLQRVLRCSSDCSLLCVWHWQPWWTIHVWCREVCCLLKPSSDWVVEDSVRLFHLFKCQFILFPELLLFFLLVFLVQVLIILRKRAIGQSLEFHGGFSLLHLWHVCAWLFLNLRTKLMSDRLCLLYR